jgi:hypothetical protein
VSRRRINLACHQQPLKMFFGKPPEFEDLMETVLEFQDEFNRKAGAKSS